MAGQANSGPGPDASGVPLLGVFEDREASEESGDEADKASSFVVLRNRIPVRPVTPFAAPCAILH